MIKIDVAKAGAQLFSLNNVFNVRVHDGFTPAKVQWINSTDGNNPLDVKGMKAFLKGQIGQGAIKDDHVELEPKSDLVSWEDDGSSSQPNGVTLIKLPPQVFTRDGIFYGYIGLMDTSGTVITSINIWFNVDQNIMTAGANVPYYLDEIQAALSAIQQANDTLQRAKQEIDNQISLSKVAFEPEAFENEAALKAKYPAGASGLMVTIDNGHKWIWANGQWNDFGVYQSVGIANHSISADKLADSIITGNDLLKPVNFAEKLNDETVGYGYSADSNNTFRSDEKEGQIHYTINQLSGSKEYTTWSFSNFEIRSAENLVLRFKYRATLRLTLEYSLLKPGGTVEAKELSLPNDISNSEHIITEVINLSGYEGFQLNAICGTFGTAVGTAELYNFEVFPASYLNKPYANLQDAISRLVAATDIDPFEKINNQLVGYGYSADDGNFTSAKLVNNHYHYILNQRTGSTAYATWAFNVDVDLVKPLVISFSYKGSLKLTVKYTLSKADGSQISKALDTDSVNDGEVHTYRLYINDTDYDKFTLCNIRGTFGAVSGDLELFDFKSATVDKDVQERSIAKIVTEQKTSYLMLNFDDATSMYKDRYDLLKTYGFRFSFCLNEGFYNNKGFLDGEREQFNQMIADGNDVALYGGVGTRPDIQTCTSDQWAAYVKPLVDLCTENGIYNVTCYHSPNNAMTANGAQGLKQLGFKMARYATSPDKSLISDFTQDSFLVPTLEIQDDNLNDVTAKIDEAIARGASLSIFTHLVQASASNEWNTSLSIYKQMLDYIKQKVDSGQIRVATWREFYASKLPQEGHENDYQRIMKMLNK